MAAAISLSQLHPEASITREQLITVLHRYARQTAASSSGRSFADAGKKQGAKREHPPGPLFFALRSRL
ncbi:hypothetical protein [Paenibacillus periandrae]|uniref:hypothetical protein n=1 Tax=Paenibacillus periandrae TaxID=1761741 RepID=UPI001F08DDA2|nr:hypothetical protein [Paenibacillus periandrae]